jgi:hypothetical protein
MHPAAHYHITFHVGRCATWCFLAGALALHWLKLVKKAPICLLTSHGFVTYDAIMTALGTDDPGGYWGPVPPPITPPPHNERQWIDLPGDLVTAARILSEAPILAVDVEFVSVRSTDASSVPRLALIQIADAHRCFVIDALRLNDLSPLALPFEHVDILKIFHGVGSDLRVLALRGIDVVHTLDLEAASRSIFGSRESGLQAMLRRACNIHLDKTLQRSDWTQRPLPSAMMAYAARDAEMTLVLYLWLNEHYRWAVDVYEEHPDDPPLATLVAPWLVPYIQGERSFPPEFIDEAHNSPTPEMLARDCVDALACIRRPIWRARILRTAADLALPHVEPIAVQSLRAIATEERSAAARALGRLRAAQSRDALTVALSDPVSDVRRAAVSAIEQLDLPPRIGRFARNEGTGAVIYTLEQEEEAPDTPWKSQLRDLLPKNEDEGRS